jgi:drug/metabolite transporter (DMT)-like permease
MDSDTVIGFFLFLTALVILIPVVLQIRDGRFHWREVWGMFVLVAGFVLVGTGYMFFSGQPLRWLSLVGLGAVLFGLLVQHKRRDRLEER